MRYGLWLILVVVMMAVAAPVYPHSGEEWRGGVSIEVVPEAGGPFQSIPHRTFWSGGTHILKSYLEARKGENYGIVIRNQTAERIGVVVAVDGRNIISGRKSNLEKTESMYIVNPYEQGRYNGWRTASDKVHRFYFTETANSYAVKTFGDSSSMGVIAVAVYREKERPRPLYQGKRLDSAPPAPSAESSAKSQAGVGREERAGTGFGNEEHSPTIRVAFEPDSRPVQKMLVKYEWRETLCQKGILNCGREPGNRLWDEGEYATFPPGYRMN
jgi:hypothetical protein